jgi:hypothetical protein
MTTTLGLVAFAVVLGVLGPRLLDRWSWPARSPLLGILAWQSLTLSVFVSFVWAGVTLAAHAMPETGWLGRVVHACSFFLAEEGGAKEGPLVPAIGVVVSVGFVVALVVTAQLSWRRQRSQVQRHHDLMRVVGVPHEEPDVVVIEHQLPTVFCVPGRGGPQVVVSRGALEVLTGSQLRQVLAHERAHLRARHHLVLRCADAFLVVLRGTLGSARARARIAELVEMHADDAAGGANRRDLAEAVVALAGGAQPLGALGAGGGSAASRVRRLIGPASPLPIASRAAIIVGLGALVLAPALIAVTPGLASAFLEVCPFLF